MRRTRVIDRESGEELYMVPTSDTRNCDIERDIIKGIKKFGKEEFHRRYNVIHGLDMAHVLEYCGIPYTTWEGEGQMSFADFGVYI